MQMHIETIRRYIEAITFYGRQINRYSQEDENFTDYEGMVYGNALMSRAPRLTRQQLIERAMRAKARYLELLALERSCAPITPP